MCLRVCVYACVCLQRKREILPRPDSRDAFRKSFRVKTEKKKKRTSPRIRSRAALVVSGAYAIRKGGTKCSAVVGDKTMGINSRLADIVIVTNY